MSKKADTRTSGERHQAHLHAQMYTRMAVLFALPLALVSLIPSLVGIVLLQKEIQDRCEDSRINRDAIRRAYVSAFTPLGYRLVLERGETVAEGRPLAYYREHPDERAAELRRLISSLSHFPPIKC